MSRQRNQPLHFSISETVWLRNGEEAEEILSMALEPDIAIEESADYVTIKGALRLSGEYKPAEGAGDEAESARVYDFRPTYRTVNEITETDVGTALLEHRFPVDITIPAHRIADIEDIYVTVESFDYKLPEKGCLRLDADIAITGLIDDREEENDSEISEQAEGNEAFEPADVAAFDSYRLPQEADLEPISPQVEFKGRQDAGSQAADREAVETNGATNAGETPVFSRQKQKTGSELSREPEIDAPESAAAVRGAEWETGGSDDDDVVPTDPAGPFQGGGYIDEDWERETEDGSPSRFGRDGDDEFQANLESDWPHRSESPERTDDAPTSGVRSEYGAELRDEDDPERPPSESRGDAFAEEDAESGYEEIEETADFQGASPLTKREENALYLTKMLTGEGERFARVKMCIVQRDDSLESISARYNVPISTILRRNALESDALSAGQVLYIPISNKNKSS